MQAFQNIFYSLLILPLIHTYENTVILKRYTCIFAYKTKLLKDINQHNRIWKGFFKIYMAFCFSVFLLPLLYRVFLILFLLRLI